VQRTQIQLSTEQQRRLKILATQRGTSVAELVREGIDLLLLQEDRRKRWRRAWKAVGAGHEPAGASDVAERHDDYLREIYARDLGVR